jgi:hypothetical protein
MRCRRLAANPAAQTAVTWIAVLAALVSCLTVASPARADGDRNSTTSTTTTTEPTITTTEPVTTTTELVTTTTIQPATTAAESASSTTTQSARSTTTTSEPDGSTAGGTLTISAPSLRSLGTERRARTFAAHLGKVTVTDTRGAAGGAWTATVSATSFVTGRGSLARRLPRSSIAYRSGPATGRTGSAVLLPGQSGRRAVALSRPRIAFSARAATGANSASWNPTIFIRVPGSAVAGRYRGAIIHSVA